jgi:hypothetical protein
MFVVMGTTTHTPVLSLALALSLLPSSGWQGVENATCWQDHERPLGSVCCQKSLPAELAFQETAGLAAWFGARATQRT